MIANNGDFIYYFVVDFKSALLTRSFANSRLITKIHTSQQITSLETWTQAKLQTYPPTDFMVIYNIFQNETPNLQTTNRRNLYLFTEYEGRKITEREENGIPYVVSCS